MLANIYRAITFLVMTFTLLMTILIFICFLYANWIAAIVWLPIMIFTTHLYLRDLKTLLNN